MAGFLVRWLGSLKLTIVLAAILAAVLVFAAGLEAAKGREYAQWYVYDRGWFLGVLGALAASIAAATLVRLPWRRPGLAIVAAGLIVLLAGFIQTLVEGVEGQLILWQGATAEAVSLTHRSQLMLVSHHGEEVQSTELDFSPGPADWRDDEPLDFDEVDGTAVRVLRFYRHARCELEWVADESGPGVIRDHPVDGARAAPAIQVAVSDPQGRASGESWWVPSSSDGSPIARELRVSIEQAPVESLRADFLHPPAVKPGTRGILSVHYKDRVYPIPVDGNIGKPVPVGDGGLTVEIVEYYANAKSSKEGLTSEGDEPKNPMLRLRVQTPGQKQPVLEIAYANRPFVNYESIRKQPCPVKFWYHHPAAMVSSAVEFLQTPDGKLYCRTQRVSGAGGAYQPRGEVKEGDRIAVSADRQLCLLRHIPHARQDRTFAPVEVVPGQASDAEAAALVELTTAGRSERFWLGRNDPQLGVRNLQTPDGPLVVMFGYERYPLGFAVRLIDFHRDTAPDSASDAPCVSRVLLSEGTPEPDVISASDPLREISTNSPLRYGTFTFHQSGFRQLPGTIDLSVLRVTSDPGRLLKYLGGAMVCVGVLFLVYPRVFLRRRVRSAVSNAPAAGGDEHQKDADRQSQGCLTCARHCGWPATTLSRLLARGSRCRITACAPRSCETL